jgi:hypothetical protein
MHKAAFGRWLIHFWLPQFLAALLVVMPIYADAQTPAGAQNPPAQAAPAQAAGPAPATPQKPLAPLPTVKNLKILALAGNGEMNDLERKVMTPLVVQVLDQNDRPVEGAEVVFRFPPSGPGAAFQDGKPSLTIRANATGEAAAVNWMANGQVGSFDVHVTATYGNQMGETTIRMSNVTRIVETGKRSVKHQHWYSPTWVKIALVGAAAGAVAGIVLATRGGSHSTSSNGSITITPGPPSVGGPH